MSQQPHEQPLSIDADALIRKFSYRVAEQVAATVVAELRAEEAERRAADAEAQLLAEVQRQAAIDPS